MTDESKAAMPPKPEQLVQVFEYLDGWGEHPDWHLLSEADRSGVDLVVEHHWYVEVVLAGGGGVQVELVDTKQPIDCYITVTARTWDRTGGMSSEKEIAVASNPYLAALATKWAVTHDAAETDKLERQMHTTYESQINRGMIVARFLDLKRSQWIEWVMRDVESGRPIPTELHEHVVAIIENLHPSGQQNMYLQTMASLSDASMKWLVEQVSGEKVDQL